MISPGDRVSFIDDNISGVVVWVKDSSVLVKCDDGFEIKCFESEIIKVGDFDRELSNYIDYSSMRRILEEKNQNKKKTSAKRPKQNDQYLIDVDLHIEKIVKSFKHMDSSDILEYQLNRAKYKLEEAISKKIYGLVFIHGHGDGVLKYELYSLLKKYNVSYSDADYSKYGGGATQVIIR